MAIEPKEHLRVDYSASDTLLQIASGVIAIVYSDGSFAAALGAFGGSDEGEWHAQNLAAVSYLTLPVRINGVPLEAIIDSGASRSVVRRDLALELGLPSIGTALATTVTGQVAGTTHRVRDLYLEVGTLHDLEVASYDLSRCLETMLRPPAYCVDGLSPRP